MMHAVRIHGYGGPEVMQLEELPTPVPGPGQVRVRVEAASVNFLDVQKRRGDLVAQAFYRRSRECERHASGIASSLATCRPGLLTTDR